MKVTDKKETSKHAQKEKQVKTIEISEKVEETVSVQVNGTNSVTEKVANKKEDTVEPKSVKSTEVSAETQTKAAPLPKEEEITDSDD